LLVLKCHVYRYRIYDLTYAGCTKRAWNRQDVRRDAGR